MHFLLGRFVMYLYGPVRLSNTVGSSDQRLSIRPEFFGQLCCAGGQDTAGRESQRRTTGLWCPTEPQPNVPAISVDFYFVAWGI